MTRRRRVTRHWRLTRTMANPVRAARRRRNRAHRRLPRS